MTKKLYMKLLNADSEKLVESAYHEALQDGIKKAGGVVHAIKTATKTDGIVDGEFNLDGKIHVFRIIVETKFDETYSNAITRARVLAQVIYYFKQFENLGESLPNIIFVGDKNECFVIHSNQILKYITQDHDWTIAPSEAHRKNIQMVKDLTDDLDVQSQCLVYAVDENFDFNDVIEQIKGLASNTKQQVAITEKNIAKIFDHFTLNILHHKANGDSIYKPREQVEYFITLILEFDNCYTHPKKKGVAMFNKDAVKVNVANFEAFLNHYTFKYNMEEKKKFTEISDRLIEDSERRFNGDFYTPTVWVDEAHKTLAKTLGVDWKNDYMVWDSACGTKNLTRDYSFKELYSSTLHEHDINISTKYNTEGVSFQYDFLNDDVLEFDRILQRKDAGFDVGIVDFHNTKLWTLAPELILGLLEGRKLLFFINPPYGTAGNRDNTGKSNKIGTADTEVNKLMKRYKMGASSQQLYAQFIYRIMMFNRLFGQVSFALFSKPSFMIGATFKGLREELYKEYSYKYGHLFQASEFADVSGLWGVSFTIWQEGTTERNQCIVDIKTFTDSKVRAVDKKLMYYADNSMSDWVKEPIKKVKVLDAPQMTNAINVKPTGHGKITVVDALGYCHNNSNNVMQNTQYVGLYASSFSDGHGVAVSKSNYLRVVSSFTARKLITGRYANWINDKDEYMIPDIHHPLYKQWERDCIIYSLFNVSSNQSSLRDIIYNNKTWDIYNEHFFMSRDDIKQLALDHYNDEIYTDIEKHGKQDRYVYTLLDEHKGLFSVDAQKVLDKAIELIRLSFDKRNMFQSEFPDYQVNSWDAGWGQLKALLKEYHPDELKEFNQLYKDFEDRMRPLVYELGFLLH